MRIAFVAVLLFATFLLSAQPIVKKNYQAKNLENAEINIDGNFNETQWQTAHWENQFIQHEPKEGRPPYQQTEFALLYDANNLYVAIRALDKNPDSISTRLSRRDEIEGDLVGIFFDSYHDLRTGFGFIVSAAGVRSDVIQSNDGESEDGTWDPIWFTKTRITEQGWNAEMKIPLTQLRFEEGEEQLWGMQVLRFIFRKEELSAWQPMKREISGFISQFGTLSGIKNIKPKNSLNVMPYVVARTERFEKELENPFRNSGKNNGYDVGLDAKIGLTNYLTLDLSINPDFGQVEADPSEVNLSTYETFFEEKRPFFIEGKNILTYKMQFGDGDLAANNLFYSRRIGRRPQYFPDLNDNEYVKTPDFTKILGAVKISGKTKNGWSVGILESVTARENAEIKSISNSRNQSVEPLSNYFVSRIQKDFNNGNTYLGGMITAVNRKIEENHLEFLHKSAYSGGIDFVHKWDNKNWLLDAGLFFSQVNGSEEAIAYTQKSYIRTFHRPNADYLNFDEKRTSLAGHGGKFTVAKVGGKFKVGSIFSWKSPGLEVNDIGYAQQVDNIMQVLWAGYRFYEPFSIFRNASLNFNQWNMFDFGGTLFSPGGNLNGHAQFKNYWNGFASFNVNGRQIVHSALRGGPSLKSPGSKNFYMGFTSNQQKKLTINFENRWMFSNEKDFEQMQNFSIGIGYRPINTLRVEISPGFSDYTDKLMYVTQLDYQNHKEYIFAKIERHTLTMSFRVNYNITPDLTIQYWGQPFVATGKYDEFKRITNSMADDLYDRFHLFQQGSEIIPHYMSGNYNLDFNADGNSDYVLENPDFNVKEFLSNLVLRWEYHPGSTLFLVWSQTRNGYDNYGDFEFSRDLENLFDVKAKNIFLLKFSYRIGR